MPGGVRSSGEWRLLRARSQRAPRESRRRGRIGEQLGRTGDRGSGRDGGLEEEGAGAPASAPPPTGGGCGSARRRREGPGAREKEGKEEEVKGEGTRSPKRASAEQSGPERTQQPLWRHGPGSQGKGPQDGLKEGPTLCRQEENKAIDVEQQQGEQRQLLNLGIPGPGDRGCVRGGDKGSGNLREVPGSADGGDAPEHETLPLDHLRRRGGAEGHQSCGPFVLPERPHQEGKRCPSPRVVDPLNDDRRPVEGPAGSGPRRVVPAAEVPGTGAGRHSLGSCPENRAGGWRGASPHCPRGAADRPERELLGGESSLADPEQQRQGSPKGEDKGQIRQRPPTKRRQEGGCEARQGQRRRKEVAMERLEGALPMRAAPDKGDATGGSVRELGSSSYATPGVFLAGFEPDPGVKIFPTVPDEGAESLADFSSGTGAQPRAHFGPDAPPFFPHLGLDQPQGDPVTFKHQGHPIETPRHSAGKHPGLIQQGTEKSLGNLEGSRLVDLGLRVQQMLLEVSSLRSQSMGRRSRSSLFPLPSSSSVLSSTFPHLTVCEVAWLSSVCLSLNTLWGDGHDFCGEVSPLVKACLVWIVEDVQRIAALEGRLEVFDWDHFFSTRSIDYKGDEVKTAREFTWQNIAPALPKEIGRVPLADVCTLGSKHYVENLDLYIRPPDRWERHRPPRVMVPEAAWPEVCQGLVSTGICTLLRANEVFQVDGKPLLNGLFGVSKDEWSQGHEVFRLIMNLVPFNGIAEAVKGDVDTLPAWSLMSPFYLQPSETLLISSEDVRCFFYTMSVPNPWYKYMAFNRRVPDQCLPSDMRGEEVYLASKVLPMGFANSVSLAQHVHRNLTLWSQEHVAGEAAGVAAPEAEIRKDRPVTVANPSWRIYLDNYDLLEKVKSVDVTTLTGSLAPAVLALRQEYEVWEVPRNLKKAVQRQTLAEVQGAQVDGNSGVAYPRENKLLKYLAATLKVLTSPVVTQRQMQVVCGGLVYVSMFRRQLLGCLNEVWKFIESFNGTSRQALPLSVHCKLELIRFVGLIPLARLDFRLDYHPVVTCSDASSKGGGICASANLSRAGHLAAHGKLRGQLPELRQEHRVLTVGLFDGIAALRVAADLLGLEVMGHISVEKESTAQRVVTSHFPETKHITDVAAVTEAEVQGWAREFSQASLVLIGGGPPCQGVSGLNSQRKGALRDERSSLFPHVRRIGHLVERHFPWCQVHCIMESVASMDAQDRDIMSADFGDSPWFCDAGTLTWTSRPRLYWITWELQGMKGASLSDGSSGAPREVRLEAYQDLEEVCCEGWIKVDPSRPFPTFTTARPRAKPGHKPAGIHTCNSQDLERWVADRYRFPPYQYTSKNLLVNKQDVLRLPTIEEKEYMLGFPVGYTSSCSPKQLRGTTAHADTRHTLVGNTWSVPVIAWFISQLCGPLGLCPLYTPQQIVDFLNPVHQTFLQSRLWRAPVRPLRGQAPAASPNLVAQLGQLVSVKGEDILLTAASSQLVKFHRLRASVPARLWKWKVISGWKWRGSPEHINSLELRAVLTSLKWRIQHQKQIKCRFLHLVDSLVVLHAMARGRSSSRKLRSTLSRINALLLCSSSQALVGYVHTDQNPADRPSRWGSRVKSKFRNA